MYQFPCLSHRYEKMCIDLPNSEHRTQARSPNTANINVHNLINIHVISLHYINRQLIYKISYFKIFTRLYIYDYFCNYRFYIIYIYTYIKFLTCVRNVYLIKFVFIFLIIKTCSKHKFCSY